jgi:hypothetical protein
MRYSKGYALASRLSLVKMKHLLSCSDTVRSVFQCSSSPRLFGRGRSHRRCPTFSPVAARGRRCGGCRAHEDSGEVGRPWDAARDAIWAGEGHLDLHEVVEGAWPQGNGEDGQSIARGGRCLGICTSIWPYHRGYGSGVANAYRIARDCACEFSIDRYHAFRAVGRCGFSCPPTAIVGEQRGGRRRDILTERDGDGRYGGGRNILASISATGDHQHGHKQTEHSDARAQEHWKRCVGIVRL